MPAAGLGLRMGGSQPKALLLLAGEPLLLHAVRGLRACPAIGPIVVAAPAAHLDEVSAVLGDQGVTVVAGGRERQDSVRLALAELDPSVALVVVHDAARALTPPVVVERVVAALQAGADAVVPVMPIADTLKQVEGDHVVRTVDRGALRAVQTPQGFRRTTLVRAHGASAPAVTDDAALLEELGETVRTVEGHEEAFKVTTPFDLRVAEALLRSR